MRIEADNSCGISPITPFPRAGTQLLSSILGIVVLVAAPAQARDRNGYSAAYEDRESIPKCSGGEREGVKIVSKADHWRDINSSKYRIFCVKPGDYRAAGKIILKRDGSEDRRRFIIPYNRDSSHPVKTSKGRQIIIKHIEFNKADHWYVDGLTVKDFRYANSFKGAKHNTISRSLFEGDNLKAGRGILDFSSRSHHNTVQNSVLRNCATWRNRDQPGVRVAPGSNYNRIVSNEIYNCTDQIMFNGTGRIEGTVIENNDLYITSSRYSLGNGKRSSKGAYACAENGIDIKSGTTQTSESKLSLILNNRIWGFRPGDDRCDGTGAPNGSAVIVHQKGGGIVMEDNIIFDSGRGIGFPNNGARNVRVENNVIHTMRSKVRNGGLGIFAVRAQNSQFYFNTIVDSDAYVWAGGSGEFKCNAVINSGEPMGKWKRKEQSNYNGYYASSPSSDPNSYVSKSASASKYKSLCFYRKLLTGSQKVCLNRGKSVSSAPHMKLCQKAKLK